MVIKENLKIEWIICFSYFINVQGLVSSLVADDICYMTFLYGVYEFLSHIEESL